LWLVIPKNKGETTAADIVHPNYREVVEHELPSLLSNLRKPLTNIVVAQSMKPRFESQRDILRQNAISSIKDTLATIIRLRTDLGKALYSAYMILYNP